MTVNTPAAVTIVVVAAVIIITLGIISRRNP